MWWREQNAQHKVSIGEGHVSLEARKEEKELACIPPGNPQYPPMALLMEQCSHNQEPGHRPGDRPWPVEAAAWADHTGLAANLKKACLGHA